MILSDFLKVLDTIEPITIYIDGYEEAELDVHDIPAQYKSLELTDVFVDEEGLGVSIYTP